MVQPSPARAIWSHLPSGEVERSEQVREAQPSPLAQAMYPRKSKPTNRYEEILIKHLKELTAKWRRR